ncbi:MAG: RluA family pseudouridine synthase [Bacteroidales bacterium]|nr:RluA family pseudouridine synthase [Bacteroidales bacterium]
MRKTPAHTGHRKSPEMEILYEDTALVVVDKPCGLLTQSPDPGKQSVQTVLNAYFEQSRQRARAHTVHRLDRDTSGLLLFAKSKKIALLFEDNWKERVYDRRYIALVHGRMTEKEGTITSWLKDNRQFVTYSSPYDNGGKYAVTHFRTLEVGEAYSMVELRLDTGRKNQIRVHLQDIGFPVAGDRKYGDGSDPEGRLCLHAFRLCFRHPLNGKDLRFETRNPFRLH